MYGASMPRHAAAETTALLRMKGGIILFDDIAEHGFAFGHRGKQVDEDSVVLLLHKKYTRKIFKFRKIMQEQTK